MTGWEANRLAAIVRVGLPPRESALKGSPTDRLHAALDDLGQLAVDLESGLGTAERLVSEASAREADLSERVVTGPATPQGRPSSQELADRVREGASFYMKHRLREYPHPDAPEITMARHAPGDEECPACQAEQALGVMAARLQATEQALQQIERMGGVEDEIARLEQERDAFHATLVKWTERAEAAEAEVARLRDGLRRCPICTHEWHRHDPEDGKCDAGSGDLGECPCGRDDAYHRVRNAALSKAALLAEDGAA